MSAHPAMAPPLTLATATPGGGFPLYGEAFAATLEAADPGLKLLPRHTRGSTENLPLLRAGAVDLALVQGEVVQAAFAGGAPAGLSILWAMYPAPGMFVVRGDSAATSIAALRGRRVAWGARGSGLVLLARAVLDGLGLDPERDFEAVFLDRAGDGPAMVLDGRVAALWGGGAGWPGFAAVAEGPAGARFLAPEPADVPAILARQPFLRRMTLPAGSYAGQAAPVASVGSWSFVLARPGLEEAMGYRLARALHRGEADLARRLPQARESTAQATAGAADPALLHPGVRRALREWGSLP
ncbi:TAXI family TRAP transporter solute-binding subunit [Paeniroseomonas aquatica]|uniref:TAXI family TRAP transporter solute-binding subunit n=1 Tax=Paeniroseomonas aquatica TaxID=373043 RepID=A0ABT8A4F0_9PROT|nr:TAXI family TRAP transporter solute-binding subunit [Paeniroseomonas aquatica]MDN3564660.1 TAXI family TRAP transporter solute-binding subunit [Paeniroseomonas aquatica]